MRQSWLKEEEQKLSSSGSGATPTAAAAAAAAKTSFVGLFSLSGTNSTAAADPEVQLLQHYQQQQQEVATSVADSGSSTYSHSRAASLGILAVPALRLLEVSDAESDAASNAATYRSTAGPSATTSVANTAREDAAAAQSVESYRPPSPIKPILRRTDTGRSNKHVQITVESEGSSPWQGLSSPKSPAAEAVGSRSWKDHQLKHQLTLQLEGADSAASTLAAPADIAGSVPVSPNGVVRYISGVPSSPTGLIRHSSRAGLEAAASSTPKGSKSRSSSNKKEKQLPALLLTDADDVIAAAAASFPGSPARSSTCSFALPGSGESTSALLVSSGSNSPGITAPSSFTFRGGSSSGGAPLGPLVQDDVCYTPHAPEEGGRLNAMLMRKLNKGKSLQRLEEVMLMVASRAADAAEGQQDWG